MTHLRSIILLICFSAALTACNKRSTPPPEEAPVPETVDVGGETDEHGCIAAAGYTWSRLRKECIRVWENAVALESTDPEASGACYLHFSEENIAEAFFSEEEHGQLLNPKGDHWVTTNNTYRLTKDSHGQYKLYNTKGLLLYHSAKE